MIEVIHKEICEALSSVKENTFDLIIADPPYGNLLDEQWDKIKDYPKFTHEWMSECHRVLKDTGSIYVWCSIGRKSTSLVDIYHEIKSNWILQDMIVWSKQRGRGNRAGWLFTREEILWATKTNDYFWNRKEQYSTATYDPAWAKRLGKEDFPYKRATNVWTDIDEPTIEMVKNSGGRGSRQTLHPAQKPEAAIRRLVLAHTEPGYKVLDAFSGSGTTALVCKTLGLDCMAIESDEKYIEIINGRLENG
jgi:DNA modification methylase